MFFEMSKKSGFIFQTTLASILSISLVSCGNSGTAINQTTPTSPTSASATIVVTPSPSPSPTIGAPPIQVQFNINGSGSYGTRSNDVVAPPSTLSSGTQKTIGPIYTDGRLTANFTASRSIQTYNDWSNTLENTSFNTSCIKFTVALVDLATQTTQVSATLTVATTADGTGTCPDGTRSSPSLDLSQRYSGNGPWNIVISNYSHLQCGYIYGYLACSWMNPLKSEVESITAFIHTSSTN